jgi:hypothetical protein
MLRSGPLERAVEQSLVLRLFDLGALHAVLDAHPMRAGAVALTAIVARIADEPRLARSEAEALFLDLCDAYTIERPAVNSRVDDLTATSPGAPTASSSRSTATGTTAPALPSSAIASATRA